MKQARPEAQILNLVSEMRPYLLKNQTMSVGSKLDCPSADGNRLVDTVC